MSETPSDQPAQTIRPIARPRARAGDENAPLPDSSRRPLWLAGAFGGVLLAGVVIVFIAMPDVEDEPAPAPIVAAPADDAPPPLSEEERRRLDAVSQRDLAALLTQQDRLRVRGAPDWAADRWTVYLDTARAGDDAYLAEDVAGSAQAYAEALELGQALLDESAQLFDTFVADAQAALEAADALTAQRQFAAALAIDMGSAAAQAGLERARALPDVLALMSDAQASDADGDLPAAIEQLRAVLRIDPQWEPARVALNAALGRSADYQFEQTLDTAYGALTQSRFQDAIDAFDAALAMRPDSQAAQDGRFQAEEGLRLGQIALARVRALAFERRELWSEAIAQYEAALATDSTLEYAIEGLARSRARRDLEVKALNLLDNPRLLFDDTVLADARALREELAAAQPRGARIDMQLAQFDRLIAAATTELPVALVSDGLTSISLFRVGTIGTVNQTEIRLRPGTYTAIGSRNGYRDVRETFTVLPGRDIGPIEIICREPI